MGNLVKDETRVVDIGEGEHVVMARKVSYKTLFQINELIDKGETPEALLLIIRQWNVSDEGKVVDLNIENLKSIDHFAVRKMVDAMNEMFKDPKAKGGATESKPPSEKEKAA